jgi:hypothetical protein
LIASTITSFTVFRFLTASDFRPTISSGGSRSDITTWASGGFGPCYDGHRLRHLRGGDLRGLQGGISGLLGSASFSMLTIC